MPTSLSFKSFSLSTGQAFKIDSKVATVSGASLTNLEVGIIWLGGSLNLAGTVKTASESFSWFSYSDFAAGKIAFTADGSAMPNLQFWVREKGSDSLPEAGSRGVVPPIVYKHLNQAPQLSRFNLGEINEGAEIEVNTSMISVSDLETPVDQLGKISFKVTKITGGSFLVLGIASKTFTYADVAHGLVSFRHDGKNLAPTISLQAFDASSKPLGSSPHSAELTFHTVDEAPVLAVKAATVKLNSKLIDGVSVITPVRIALKSLVSLSDDETPAAGLASYRFTHEVSGCSLVNKDGLVQSPSSSFTYAEMANLFIQVSSYSGDAYVRLKSPDLSVDLPVFMNDPRPVDSNPNDGITVSNQAPGELAFNLHDIWPGQTVGLSRSHFSFVDRDTLSNGSTQLASDEGIGFVVSNVKYCVFLVNGVTVTQFRLSDVDAGRVEFQHLGQAGLNPSFSLVAKDRFGASSKAKLIDVDAAIVFMNKAPLVLVEGADLKLSPANLLLSASKAKLETGLEFWVNAVNCQIGKINSDKSFTALETFTYADLKSGQLVLRSSDSEKMPELALGVTGKNGLWIPISYKTVNDAPELPQLGKLVINLNQILTLDSDFFASAHDEELGSLLRDSLLVTLKSKIGLSFKINGIEVNSFSLADVDAGLVQVTRTAQVASWSVILTDNEGLSMKTAISSVVLSNDPAHAMASISSDSFENQWLSAGVGPIIDADGLGALSYTWQSSENGWDWQDLSTSASNEQLHLDDVHVGKKLRMKFEYTDGHGVVEQLYTAMTETIVNVNDARLGFLYISGNATPGGFLRAHGDVQDMDGLGELTYVWASEDGSVLGTGTTLHLTDSELGKTIHVTASYIDGHGTVEHVYGAETTLIRAESDQQVSPSLSPSDTWNPQVTVLKDGGWVVTWSQGDNSSRSLMQQRFDDSGQKSGAAEEVASSSFWSSSSAALSDGGWINCWCTTWWLPESTIHWQRYGADGNKIGDEGTYLPTTYVRELSTAGLESGGWVIELSQFELPNSLGVKQMIFDQNGVWDSPVSISPTADVKTLMTDVATLSDGSWVVAWSQGYRIPADPDLHYSSFQKAFNADGTERLTTSSISAKSGEQSYISVAGLKDGGWVTSWLNLNQSIMVARFDAEGKQIGGEIEVTRGNWLWEPNVCGLSDGGWVVSWSNDEIMQQRFGSMGQKIGDVMQSNLITSAQQSEANLDALPDGGWILTWKSDKQETDNLGFDIVERRFSPDTHGPVIDLTLRDTSAYDHFAPIVSQVPLNQSGWTFNGSAQGKYGSLVVQSTGQYVYTPNDEVINFLPSGTFSDSFVISGSKGEATRSDEISFAVVGVDDPVTFFGEDIGNTSQSLALADGGWWLIWSQGHNLAMQHYASSGEKIGAEIGMPEAALEQHTRQPVLLANGDWLLHSFSYSFELHQPSKSSIQRFTADGQAVGDAIVFDQSDRMSVCALSDGGWVVFYPMDGHAFLRRFAADGQVVSDGDLSIGTDLLGYYLKIASLPDGGWALSWLENLAQTQGQYLKVFDADGSSTAAIMVNEFPWSQYPGISLHSLVNGNLVISSSDYTTGTTTLKVMTPAGVEVFHKTYQDYNLPEITNLNDGTWLARIGREANSLWQHFAADGSLLEVEASQLSIESIEGLKGGGWILTASGLLQRYDSAGHILSFSEQHGTAAADTLTGSAGAWDRFYDLGAGDSASGLAGQDLFELNSSAFAAIDGGADEDTLRLTFDLDLSLITSKLVSIEKLDLNGHAIQIDSADITALGGSLVIDGSASSSVTLSEEWLETGDSSGYQHLTHGELSLLIAIDIPVL